MTSQQLFLNTRSVTTAHTASVLRVLYKDFRSEDPIVRLVMLLTIFLSDPTLVPPQILHTTESSPAIARFVDACSDEIEELELGPLTRKDIVDILLSKFVPERFGGILAYARSHLKLDADATRSIITEVALGCLEIGCKGKMLGKLVDAYGYLSDVLAVHIVKNYRIQVEDLPPVEEEKACRDYSAPLCADLMKRGVPLMFEESGVVTAPVASESVPPPQPQPAENEMEVARGDDEAEAEEGVEDPETLGDADGEDLVRGCSHPCSFLTPFAKYALMCGSAGAHWPRHTICDDPQRRNDALPPAAVSRTLYDLSRQQQVAISSWYVAKEVLPPLSEWHPGLDRSFFCLASAHLPRLHPGRLVAPEPFWAPWPSRRRGPHPRRHQSELYGTYRTDAGPRAGLPRTEPLTYRHFSRLFALLYAFGTFVPRQVLHQHPYTIDSPLPSRRVPTTLKHFKILARLGRTPSMSLYDDIEAGTEFYFSEEDYLSHPEWTTAPGSQNPTPLKSPKNQSGRVKVHHATVNNRSEQAVKCEASPTPGPSNTAGPSSASPRRVEASGSGSGPGLASGSGSGAGAGQGNSKKRPRRSVASAAKSYVVPDSDDEDIVMEGEDESLQKFAKKRRQESNMQRWIKQLTVLYKDEQRKVRFCRRSFTPPFPVPRYPRRAVGQTIAAYVPSLLLDSTTIGNAAYTLQPRLE